MNPAIEKGGHAIDGGSPQHKRVGQLRWLQPVSNDLRLRCFIDSTPSQVAQITLSMFSQPGTRYG
jgi:hypothetical protein